MSKREKAYQRIVSIFHRYREYPNMLCHMMMENGAFSEEFLSQMSNGDYETLPDSDAKSFREVELYVRSHVFNDSQREPITDPSVVIDNLEREHDRMIDHEEYERAKEIMSYIEMIRKR